MNGSGVGRSRRLVVNADDLGWSRGIDRGIVETHERGIVTSASLLATGAAFEHAVELACATPTLSIGVHLNIYRGRPLLDPVRIPSVTGADGAFLGSVGAIVRRLLMGRFDLGEVAAEFRAQIERVRDAGLNPVHVNGDKHLHLWPSVFRVTCALASDFGIPSVRVVRDPPSAQPIAVGLGALSLGDARLARASGLMTPGGTIGVAHAPTDLVTLERLLASARGERVELIVHPGYLDDEFWDMQAGLPNKLVRSRELQREVLGSEEARRLVKRHGFELRGTLAEDR